MTKSTPAPDAVRLVPNGEPVSLRDCPPGPFLFNGHAGFKTEYGAMETVGPTNVPGPDVRWTVGNGPDAYVLESGETFWGGAKSGAERDALIVQPLAAAPAPATARGGADWINRELLTALQNMLRDYGADEDTIEGQYVISDAQRAVDEALAALASQPQATGGAVPSFLDAEAMAEAWSDRVEIQRMVETTSAVFSKWASPELLSRFRQQMMGVIQQAYIEGLASLPAAPSIQKGDEG